MNAKIEPFDRDVLAEARRRAVLERGRWLQGLAERDVTPVNLFKAASRNAKGPLRKVALMSVLDAIDVPASRSRVWLDRLAELAGTDKTAKELTVGWLIDPRSMKRRLALWAETVETEIAGLNAPCDGYPWVSCNEGLLP